MFELLFNHPRWAYRTGTFAFASGWPVWLLFVLVAIGAIIIGLTLLRRRFVGGAKLAALFAVQATLLALVLCLIWRPVLHVERVRDRENVLAVAIDASASMAYGEEQQSRLQQAAAALEADTLPALRKTFDVRLFSFAAQTQSIDSFDALPAPGPQTRIGDALQQLLQTAASVPLAGIVLVSDGAENGGTLSEERLAELASYGVPIHTVGVGPEKNPNDLEIDQLRVPQNAAAGATITAEVAVRHDGAAKSRLRVYDRDRLLAAKELSLPQAAEISNVSVELPAGDPGTHDLRFELDALEGERNVINNARRHVLNVPVTRRRVLYLEGEPRWEYKFLRRAIEGERALRLTSVVRTTPNKFFRQGVDSGSELTDGLPKDAAELFTYDALIIGSYDAASLSTQQHQLLRDFVDKRGGSVLLLASRSGLSAGGWQDSALAQALPTHLPQKEGQSFVQRAAQAQPTVYGMESAVVRLAAESKQNLEQWKTLPPLADYQALGKLKPGSIVLLEATNERTRAPLLVWQRYGRGATYVLGTGSTLRWQMQLPPDDQRHEMFWRQLAHALADNARARTTLGSERTVYDDDRRVSLEAEVLNERFEPISNARVEVLVAPELEPSYQMQMTPSGNNDGRYVVNLDAPSTGLYRVDLTAFTGDVEVGSASTYVRRNDGTLEHFGARQNRPVLERIAAMTGGRYWRLEDLGDLAAAIPYSKAGIVERQTLDLWNLPIVFVVLLALKMGEWLMRLSWGRL